MTKRKGTAGIVDANRYGTIYALSRIIDFIAKMLIRDAALLGAVIGLLVGWRWA